MTSLEEHLQDYLRLRRLFGFKLRNEEATMTKFVAFLRERGIGVITIKDAVEFVRMPEHAKPLWLKHRMRAIRGFAIYVRTIDPATEVPSYELFECRAVRPVPYIYSQAEIEQLLAAARELQPFGRAVLYETLFGLLAVSGMRINEAIMLQRHDVDLTTGLLTVRDAKFRRDRLVPLHPSVTEVLRAYVVTRDRLHPSPGVDNFFVSNTGGQIVYETARTAFVSINTTIGTKTPTNHPRLHDLRHSFAVRTIIDWQRNGIDIDTRMGVLSNYLGHANPTGTYWYLSAVPELMSLAAERLARRYGPLT